MLSSNRRTFLAGLAAGAMASYARASFAGAPNQRIVVAVMGLGRGAAVAQTFAQQPDTVVKYLCDVDSARSAPVAKSFEARYGTAPEVITDFRHALDDKDVDVLVCAAPNHWHGPATILACAAGKHVYVEKPCCHNPQEGEWMVAAARKYRRCVQMGNQRRSAPGTQRAIQRLKEGAIGRVYLAKSWYNNNRPPIGKGVPAEVPSTLNYDLWQGPAPRRPYLTNRIHYNWHWFWHWGNGELGNNGVHTIDLCRWGLGVDYPTRVVSTGYRYRYDDEQETPDTHMVAFEFGGQAMIVWEGRSCHRHNEGFVKFYGESGTMALESNGTYTIYDMQDKQVEREVGNTVGDAQHAANLLEAIRADDPERLNSEIEEGHKSTLLCHLGNIAYRTTGSVQCDPANGRLRAEANPSEALALWSREYEPGWEPKF
ncbi:MAG: NADH-dependent dehydrogenase [Pirellulaceae bacterium]|nr:MAG: NADH-dependent dehydrogenase [Pirellulaceae bacterium]